MIIVNSNIDYFSTTTPLSSSTALSATPAVSAYVAAGGGGTTSLSSSSSNSQSTAFLDWCETRGIRCPLVLQTDDDDDDKSSTSDIGGLYRSRSMGLPPKKDDLFALMDSDDNSDDDDDDISSNNNILDGNGKKINVIQVPLDSCIIGDDLPTLVDRLMYEKLLGDESEFKPWIDVFPPLEVFEETMPRFWSNERIDFISKYDSGQLKARLDLDMVRINKIVQPSQSNEDSETGDDETSSSKDRKEEEKKDTMKLKSWALACVDSRSNFLPDNTYSLTPLLDMFNHDPRYTTTAQIIENGDTSDGPSSSSSSSSKSLLLEVDSNAVLGLSNKDMNAEEQQGENNNKQGEKQMDWKDQLFGLFQGINQKDDDESSKTSSSSYQPGRQVYISYGEFDNVETLCNYGFVSESNSCNLEQFKVRSVYAMAMAVADGGGTNVRPTNLVVDSDGKVDNLFNTMSLNDLRVSLALPDELKEYNGSGKISDRNEVEVFALVIGELDEAVYETKQGITEAKDRKDDIVAAYLEGRRRTLQKGLDTLKVQYPELF